VPCTSYIHVCLQRTHAQWRCNEMQMGYVVCRARCSGQKFPIQMSSKQYVVASVSSQQATDFANQEWCFSAAAATDQNFKPATVSAVTSHVILAPVRELKPPGLHHHLTFSRLSAETTLSMLAAIMLHPCLLYVLLASGKLALSLAPTTTACYILAFFVRELAS